MLAARSVESLEEVRRECEALGAQALVVPTDIRSDEQVAALVTAAVDRFGRIDVWLGAASVFAYGRFEQVPDRVFRELLEVNLFGQARGARAVLPQLRRQGRGTIIFIGSVYSRLATPYVSAYLTSKHAILGLAESLRQEVEAEGIAVCTVLPATIDTPIYQHAANYLGRVAHPLPPVVAADRVAAAIVRLADRPRPWRYVGRAQRIAVPLSRWMPRLAGRLSMRTMNRLALQETPADPTDGTLFAPDPPSNAVSGGWRRDGSPRA